MAKRRLRIALIAHDGQKRDMREWAQWNREILSGFELYATQATGEMVTEVTGLPVELLLPGPMGGDAQVGAMIAGRELDLVVFFWDPLTTHAHAADVQSLIRLAVLHGIGIACNRRTADLVVSSPLLRVNAARDAAPYARGA
jgi:methylglyoxal synthase